MTSTEVAALVAAFLSGGGIITGIASFVKAKPEKDQIIVSSAKDVVVIQAGALEGLRTDLANLRKQAEEMEGRFERQVDDARQAAAECLRERDELRGQRDELRAQRDEALAVNHELCDRIEALERQVEGLRLNSGGPPATPEQGGNS